MYYRNILEAFTAGTREIIGAQLTGIYLHGSLAMGCFNPKKSDIDLIVVIEQTISDAQKRKLMELIVSLNEKAPAKGLEISVVRREYCKPFVYPTPFELHFSPMHRQWFLDSPQDYVEKMKGTDMDLAAHFTMLHKYGIVLCGEEIEKVFGEVPRQNYIDSICSDIQSATEDIIKDPVYVTLNLCRVLAFLEDGLYLSKKDGGAWGLEQLPSGYHAVILDAMKCYAADENMELGQEEAVWFAEELSEMIASRR